MAAPSGALESGVERRGSVDAVHEDAKEGDDDEVEGEYGERKETRPVLRLYRSEGEGWDETGC